MSRYMIRKPEFLRGAEEARYFPNTMAVIFMSLAVFAVCSIVTFFAGMYYMIDDIELLRREGFYSSENIKVIDFIALFALGLIILFVIIHVRSIEKRPLRTIGLVKERYVLKYIIGFGAGLLLLAVNVAPAFFTMPSVFTGFKPAAFIYLAAFMLQSAGEEFLFRGYMLSALMRRGEAVWAVAVSSVVFGLFHFPNPILAMINAALLGAVLSLFVLRTGSLWGAMGLHAAWNFGLGLVTSGSELFPTDYNFCDIIFPRSGPVWLDVFQFAVSLAVIALLLFAGENRLVVRKTGEQMLYDKAFSTAKNAAAGRGQLNYLKRITELTPSIEGKTAALLFQALNCGVPAGYIRQEFGEDIFAAADALAVRYGESPESYWSRVSQYPAALSVKNAERRMEEKMRPRYAVGVSYMRPPGITQCPMLRWGITGEYCRHIMQAVDGTVNAEEYIAHLDHNICRACPARNAARGYYGAPPPR